MAGETEEIVVSGDASAAAVVAEATAGPEHLITLEDNPTYTLSVEYGDLETIFKDSATVEGKQERMQACGFYYGGVDGDEGPVTRRCARHMREEMDHRLGRTLSDAEYQTEFENLLKCIIRKADGTLVPETDFTANARLVFPGSFTFRQDSQIGAPFTRHRYNAEQRMWDGNQGLGRVPLIAEVRNSAGDPIQDVRVCFEFIPAFNPPENQKDYLTDISGASEKTRSPRSYVRSKLPTSANVPFGYNCAQNKGGKIPPDVHGTLIAQGAIPGFPYQATTDSRPNNFSVTVNTDADGKAGVVLLPSRMAGDSYKIKVYVIVAGREPIPAEIVTGGLLTVWRNLRICRIVNKPVQAGYAGAPPIAARMTGALGSISLDTMRNEYAKAFHILEADKHADSHMNMTASTYREAIRFAKRGAANPGNWNLDVLVKEDINSPFLFWLDTDTNYNANRGAGTVMNLVLPRTWINLGTLITDLLGRFLQYWNGGSLPGVTIIRSEVGDSYSYWNNVNKPSYADGSPWNATTSGLANRHRGCFVWYPNSIYNTTMPYRLTQNTMHEMGHVLYLRHHHTTGALGSESGGFAGNHDLNDWCLMGYLALTTNDYCGKCLLKLRGWNEAAL